MTTNNIQRVRYFERQFLRTKEFTDEQAYHLAMRQRHNLSHHTWGIVSGLELLYDAESLEFRIRPGMAVDGYGRELVLAQRFSLAEDIFQNKDSDILEVWLVYSEQAGERADDGFGGCHGSRNGRGRSDFYRTVETPRVDVRKPDPSFRDRRRPVQARSDDLDFGPDRSLPADPLDPWPVFLGQIIRETTVGDEGETSFRVNPADRPYVGLRGERLVAPSGKTVVQVGIDPVSRNEPPIRFGVFVDDQVKEESEEDAQTPQGGPTRPRLAIDTQGRLDLRGETTLHGNLTIDRQAIEFRPQSGPDPESELRLIPPPWTIYHRFGDASYTRQPGARENSEGTTDELRIVMNAPNGDVATGQVVIGAFNEEGVFKHCLAIANNGNVTVNGDLFVEGQIDAKSGIPASGLSEQTRQLLASVFQASVTGPGLGFASTAQATIAFLSTDAGIEVAVPIILQTEFGQQQVAEQLASSMDNFAEVAEALVEQPSGPDTLEHALEIVVTKDFDGDEDAGRRAVTKAISDAVSDSNVLADVASVVTGEVLTRFLDIVNHTSAGRKAAATKLAAAENGQAALASVFQETFNNASVPADNPLLEVLADLVVLDAAAAPPPQSGVMVVRDALLQIVTDADANSSAEQEGRNAIAGGIQQIADDTTAVAVFGPFVAQNEDYVAAFLKIVHSHEDGRTKSAETLVALADGIHKFAAELEDDTNVQPLVAKLLSSDDLCDSIVKELGDFSSTTNPVLERFAGRLAELDVDPSDMSTKFRLVDLAKQIFENSARMKTVAESLPSLKNELPKFIEGLIKDSNRAKNFVSNLVEVVDSSVVDPVEAQKGMLAVYGSLNDSSTRVTTFGKFLQERDTQTGGTLANELIEALGGTPPTS